MEELTQLIMLEMVVITFSEGHRRSFIYLIPPVIKLSKNLSQTVRSRIQILINLEIFWPLVLLTEKSIYMPVIVLDVIQDIIMTLLTRFVWIVGLLSMGVDLVQVRVFVFSVWRDLL